jgi:hypothetical protein
VIRPEHLAVHLVRQHDATVRVHDPVQLHRCAIISIGLHIVLDVVGGVVMLLLTSLSAPSMHTYFAFRNGFARSMISFMTTPVKSAVDTPAGPHEKPLLFLTTFCSFRLLPAQTKVMGYVTFSYSSSSCRKVIFSGFATRLRTR